MFGMDTGFNVRARRISGILGISRSRSIAEGPAVIPVMFRIRRKEMEENKEMEKIKENKKKGM